MNDLGIIPPQSTDLEQVVLGALLMERDAINAVDDILIPECFYKESHMLIYTSILEMYDRGLQIDLLTISQDLRTKGKLEIVGGLFYLTELTSRINSAANIEQHSRIIQQNYIRRLVIDAGIELSKKAYDETKDIFETLDFGEKQLFDATSHNMAKAYQNMRSLVRKAFNELEEKCKSPEKIGVPSGLKDLDDATGGWQNSDLIILAARPSMGKTALAMTICRNAAIDHKRPVAFFSLEMSSIQLTNRLISAECSLDGNKIKKAKLDESDWSQLHSNVAELTDAPIFIDDTANLTIREFRSKARRLKQKHNVQLIVVDYLQLMSAKGNNTEEKISSISRGLKIVAKELDIPVIALAQLSRAVESRGGDKRPKLSDLRDSGAIEQDADVVMFLYRPEYYGFKEITDKNDRPMNTEGLAEVIIAKQRNGSLENIPLKFIPKHTKFEDYIDLSVPTELPSGQWTPVPEQDKLF